MYRKLAGWKKLYLSNEGILTLTRSTLSFQLFLFLSLIPLPGGVAKFDGKFFQKDFLLDGMGDEIKFQLVNYNTCRTPICH